MFASLMLINAVFFHILPVIRMRGQFRPGIVTAVVLFFGRTSRLAGRVAEPGCVAAGALLMAYPIVMLNLKCLPYLRQS